jgi:hypothetical protein
VIAPFIVASPDRRRISWVDFRDYVGVFVHPVAPRSADYEGKPWDLPDIHFDRAQYLAEIHRAAADRSWETPRRATARLLEERLLPLGLVLPADLALRWVVPAQRACGVILNFERLDQRRDHEQRLLRLDSAEVEPSRAAEDIAEQLLSVAPEDWLGRFGHDLRTWGRTASAADGS